jgi:hypothetical protein
MKPLVKVVAAVVAVLLIVPPAIADSLCLISQPSTVNMQCCNIDSVETPSASSAVIQDCNEGCCSVAPQESPAPNVSDKLKADSVAPDAAFAVLILRLHPSRCANSPVLGAISPSQDLPVLLHTFRI